MANPASKESGQQTIVYLDAKGNLLISTIIHSIFPPSHLCLALSLIMPCTPIHPFVFFDNV
jgi:hypothetical protein